MRSLHHVVRHSLGFFGHFVEAPAHEPLDRINCVLRVGYGLALGHLANQPLAALGEGDDGGRGARTFLIRNDFGLSAL